MTRSHLVDALHPFNELSSWPQELVQSRAEDVVLAAARFKPNAAGSCEFTVGAGFGQRQLLKAEGRYLGERVVLGVTPLHVLALVLFFGGRTSRLVARWPHDAICTTLVPPRGLPVDDPRPAVLITSRGHKGGAELQVVQADEDARHLMRLLLRGNGPSPH